MLVTVCEVTDGETLMQRKVFGVIFTPALLDMLLTPHPSITLFLSDMGTVGGRQDGETITCSNATDLKELHMTCSIPHSSL